MIQSPCTQRTTHTPSDHCSKLRKRFNVMISWGVRHTYSTVGTRLSPVLCSPDLGTPVNPTLTHSKSHAARKMVFWTGEKVGGVHKPRKRHCRLAPTRWRGEGSLHAPGLHVGRNFSSHGFPRCIHFAPPKLAANVLSCRSRTHAREPGCYNAGHAEDAIRARD